MGQGSLVQKTDNFQVQALAQAPSDAEVWMVV